MKENINGNLFVLTGVGQLRNITGFIEQYHAINNIAIVLYTSVNLDVIDNIQKSISKDLFIDIQFVKLPAKLLEETKKKSKSIYKILEQVIKENIMSYKINNLFLCMGTGHYKFFENIISHTNISINLLEEGLATYRTYLQDSDKREYRVTFHDILSKLKKVLKKLYIIFKPIIQFFKKIFKSIIQFLNAILEFVVVLISYVIHKNLMYDLKNLKIKINKYKYGLISKFDNIYVCYPELMKKLNKTAKNVYPLAFNYTDEQIRFTSPEDKENVLFINQKYGIRYKEHFPIIFSILNDMGIKKVYMKFHPKEDIKNFEEIFENAKAQYPEIEVITLNDITHIPVENLINSNNITKIIALTSSSLFFSKLINENIEVISIAEEYKNRCINVGVSKKRMKMFLQDYENLDRLFKIEQFKYEGEELLSSAKLCNVLSQTD